MRYFRKAVILTILSLSCFNIWAQEFNLSVFDSIMSSNLNDDEKTEKVEALLNKADQVDPSDLSTIYYKFSKWFWSRPNWDEKKAIYYGKKEYALRSVNNDLDPDLLKRNLYNLGYFYHYSSIPDYTNSLLKFRELAKISNPDEIRLGNAYREMGDIYEESGDFQTALEYYANSERVLKKNHENYRLLTTYMNISSTYVNLDDSDYFDDFTKNYKKIEQLKKEITISTTDQAKLLLNQGIMHTITSKYDKANKFYTEALKLAEKDADSVQIFKILNAFGILHKKQHKFDEAEALHQKSVQYIKGNNNYVSSAYNNLADLFLQKNDYNNALIHYQKALNTLLLIEDSNYTELPDFKTIEVSPYKKGILIFLIDKTNAWLEFYDNTTNKEHLVHAEKTMALVDKLIDLLYFESRGELSKLFWRKKGAEIYVKAVKICYELDKPEKAFYYMEKNKGLLLLENITNIKAKQHGGIPTKIINKEYDMLSHIKNLEYDLAYENKDQNSTIKSKDSLQVLILNLKTNYEKFVDSLETDYPDYYSFKKKLNIIALETKRDNMNKDEAVIEYIIGNDEGYVIYISPQEIIFRKISEINTLNKDINSYYKLISKPFITKVDKLTYEELSNKLVHSILPFNNLNAKLAGKQINIISDRTLQHIPFETLLLNIDNEKKHLIELSEIYYNYSLSLQNQLNTLQNNTEREMVEFSIEEFKNQYLPTLSGHKTTEETLDFNSSIFENSKATKDVFLNQYIKNNIVYVSTHGGVDNGQPWLGFYDEKLTLDELYFTQSQKDMVILSACKTSVGDYVEGESVYSLSRGFINSGAKSIVATLWNVNEQSSNIILSDFNKNLNLGQTKSEALKNAKINYLNIHKNSSQSSPFYWSSIVLTGNNDALIKKNNYALYILSISGLLVLLSLFYFFNKKKEL